jgi:hypothetical protein
MTMPHSIRPRHRRGWLARLLLVALVSTAAAEERNETDLTAALLDDIDAEVGAALEEIEASDSTAAAAARSRMPAAPGVTAPVAAPGDLRRLTAEHERRLARLHAELERDLASARADYERKAGKAHKPDKLLKERRTLAARTDAAYAKFERAAAALNAAFEAGRDARNEDRRD